MTTALMLLLALLVQALGTAQAADDFLPVDEAFATSVERVDDGHVAVSWRIADKYYLYRHAFDFKLENAGGAAVGDVQIPDGEKHTDEFFGPVETYRDQLRIVVPIADGGSLPDDARIAVTYQGCADAGLCYPPQTQAFQVAAAVGGAGGGTGGGSGGAAGAENASSAPAAAAASAGAAADGNFVARQDDLAQRLASAELVPTLALFFGLGILLAFTPCILPMIPILSGLIVGSGAGPKRAFVLSLAYVLAMALAYTVFGVIAGYFGANLQAALQMPAVLLPFAAVFLALSLAAFGVFELQVPNAWQQRLGSIGTRRGGIAGAALMGFFAALIAGPCLAPPLVGALLYISSSGDMVLGGAALFTLGLGMGIPLILIGTFGAKFLPRAGVWMQQIRIFFGVILLAVALWLLSRIMDPTATLAAWGLLALGYGAYLSAQATSTTFGVAGQRAAVFLLFLYAGSAGVGVLAGDGRATQPLAGLAQAGNDGAPAAAQASVFKQVEGIEQLQAALDTAARAGRPAMVDFYADWCVECVQMEHSVFADSAVRQALDDVVALQVDLTDYDADDRALLQEMDVFGPPTMLFYRADGSEATNHRLIGQVDASGFIDHLQRATATVTAQSS